MLEQRIRALLEAHPHWSPKRVAEELQTSARVITVTASRKKIRFMDRSEVEDYIDGLLAGAERG